jgi:hypothetical protein
LGWLSLLWLILSPSVWSGIGFFALAVATVHGYFWFRRSHYLPRRR